MVLFISGHMDAWTCDLGKVFASVWDSLLTLTQASGMHLFSRIGTRFDIGLWDAPVFKN